MNSLLTNASALTVLQSLNSTQHALEATQNRVSTGMRVASASDNSAYWSIATIMRSDNSALSAVKDALGMGSATVDVAGSALQSTVDTVDKIKTKLVAAREPGVDRTKIQSEISQLVKQLASISDSASFNGENWLSQNSAAPGYNATKSVVASFTRAGANVTVGTIDVATSAIKLYDSSNQSGILDKTRTQGTTSVSVASIDISALTDSAADLTTLQNTISIVDTALADVTKAASDVGSVKQRVSLQTDFISNLMDSVTRGIGQLVDADLTRESTKLQALQTQQQLGIQSLSIANSSSQAILKLFGN